MALYLVSVEASDVESMAGLVEKGSYASVEQFLAVAIRNQLAYERQDVESRGSHARDASQKGNLAPAPIESADLQRFALGDRLVAAEGVHPTPTPHLLWGQFYRFLPLKAALRLIVNEFGEQPFHLRDAHRVVQDRIMGLADILESRKTSGRSVIRLGVGFPSRSRDLEKSMERFIVQYVGRCAGDGTLTGFPGEMGFLGEARTGEDCVVRLADAGAAFAQLPNPVLDSSSMLEALGADERRFLVEYITNAMPVEAAHMTLVARAIESGKNTPGELFDELRGFYRDTYSDKELSDSQITLMRSGCISRLVELGIVITSRSKGRAEYSVSQEEPEIVQLVLGAGSHASGAEKRREHGRQ